MKFLSLLARISAIAAGLLLTLITLLTCVSVLGRETVGKTITGDFELSAAAAGAAVALFMPWCQMRKGHIIVDFFTSKASDHTNALLDRFGALMMSVMTGLLAWRTTVGGLNALNSRSGTMIVGFPEWIVYAVMIPPMVLTAMIALVQVFSAENTAPQGDPA
ncbi:MAG: hypothetical protein RL758_856 [Pseudomonadota bacterium]